MSSTFELNPLAVSAAPLLRAIQIGGWVTKTELAESAGRQRGNIARDLTSLENAGLIIVAADPADPKPLILTDEAVAQLAAIDRAQLAGVAPSDHAPASPLQPDELLLTHGQMEPDPDNPRSDLISDAATETIDELRESILQRGLLQNLTVRPKPDQPGTWYVTGGNRRWYAIQQAIFDGDWDEDRVIRVKLRDEDAREALLTAIVENKQRQDMPPIDEAMAFARLRDTFGMSTADIAAESSLDLRVVQNRLRLLKLSEDDQERMRLPEDHDDHLTQKAALRLMATPRAEPSVNEPVSSRPDPTTELSAALAQQPVKTFGERITDKEALLLVEVADRISHANDPDFDGYTRIVAQPTGGPAWSLIEKNAIGFRQRGMVAYVTFRPISTGAGEWLRELGFYDHRDDVLFEMRTRILGADKAARLAEDGLYATDWLNLPAAGAPAATFPVVRAEDDGVWREPTLPDVAFAAAEARLDAAMDRIDPEPEQPELIPPSPEEAKEISTRRDQAELKEVAKAQVRMLARVTIEAIENPRATLVDVWAMDGVKYREDADRVRANRVIDALLSGNVAELLINLGAMRAYYTHTGRLDGVREVEPKARDTIRGRVLAEDPVAFAGIDEPPVEALRNLVNAIRATLSYREDNFADIHLRGWKGDHASVSGRLELAIGSADVVLSNHETPEAQA